MILSQYFFEIFSVRRATIYAFWIHKLMVIFFFFERCRCSVCSKDKNNNLEGNDLLFIDSRSNVSSHILSDMTDQPTIFFLYNFATLFWIFNRMEKLKNVILINSFSYENLIGNDFVQPHCDIRMINLQEKLSLDTRTLYSKYDFIVWSYKQALLESSTTLICPYS